MSSVKGETVEVLTAPYVEPIRSEVILSGDFLVDVLPIPDSYFSNLEKMIEIDDHVWFLDSGNECVTKIRKSDFTVVTSIALEDWHNDWGFDGTYLWITMYASYWVRINPETGEVQKVSLPTSYDNVVFWNQYAIAAHKTSGFIKVHRDSLEFEVIGPSIKASRVCLVGDKLFAISRHNLAMIDLQSETVVNQVATTYPDDLVAEGNHVWFSSSESVLTRVDATTGNVVASVNLSTLVSGAFIHSLVIRDGYVFASDWNEGIIYRVETSTLVTKAYRYPRLSENQESGQARQYDYLVFYNLQIVEDRLWAFYEADVYNATGGYLGWETGIARLDVIATEFTPFELALQKTPEDLLSVIGTTMLVKQLSVSNGTVNLSALKPTGSLTAEVLLKDFRLEWLTDVKPDLGSTYTVRVLTESGEVSLPFEMQDSSVQGLDVPNFQAVVGVSGTYQGTEWYFTPGEHFSVWASSGSAPGKSSVLFVGEQRRVLTGEECTASETGIAVRVPLSSESELLVNYTYKVREALN